MIELSRTEWENLIEEWILGRDSERNRELMKRHLLDGRTYKQLAWEFHLSPDQVGHIISKCRKILYRHV